MLRLKFNSTSISLMGVAALFVGLTNACADYKSENQGIGTISAADTDNDSVANDIDNCPLDVNPDQKDTDDDGIGDACDDDLDDDGVPNGDDNCRWWPNQDQTDTDLDGVGDACDNDDDDDGVCDRGLDRLPPGQIQEGQVECDGADNCPWESNSDQADLDDDGWGDVCDNDWDSDHVLNGVDNCPMVPNQQQLNLDGDKFGDKCDDDLDGDGVPNDEDNCKTLWVQGINPMDLSSQSDCDGDGKGDLCDLDFDNDGQPEVRDEFAFPNWATCPEDGNCTVDTELTDCDDDNNCTMDWCDSESGKCMHDPTNEEGSCDDGNACTTGDMCSGGSCVGGATLICKDTNPCTDNWCDPVEGCMVYNNTADCDDGNNCTTNDACDGGECVSDVIDCNDNNVCTDDSCNLATGSCVNAAVSTNDNDACTVDACTAQGGVTHTALNCDDNDKCTTDSCDPAMGCGHTAVSTNDNDACTVDACTAQGGVTHTALNCDDGLSTTVDTCNPASGCVHTALITDLDHDGYAACEGAPNGTCDCDDNGTDNYGVAVYCWGGSIGYLLINYNSNNPAARPACPEGSTLVGTTDGSFLNGPQISGHDTAGDNFDNDCDGVVDNDTGLDNCTFQGLGGGVTKVTCPWMSTAPTLPPL